MTKEEAAADGGRFAIWLFMILVPIILYLKFGANISSYYTSLIDGLTAPITDISKGDVISLIIFYCAIKRMFK